MLNKIIVATLSASLLFGGGMQGTAEASSNDSQSFSKVIQFSSAGNWEVSQDKVNNLLERYLPNVDINWDSIIKGNQPTKEKQEQKKQPVPAPKPEPEKEQKDKPAPEADKQEQKPEKKQNTNNKDEQPKADQPEAPAQQQQSANKQEQKPAQNRSSQLNAYEQEVVELTNKERTERGLAPLKIDTELSKVAREKSRDMAANNYFSHKSPTYGSPFDMMKQYGIDYRTAGENIAKGQRTPAEVVNAWMNSQGHRENILNPNFTHIGVGYVEQGNHWTQQFIGK